MACSEHIGHFLDVAVAGVIQAWQTKAILQSLQQGIMIISLVARHPVDAVVGVNDGDYLVGERTVIVFVPQHDDGVIALLPCLANL